MKTIPAYFFLIALTLVCHAQNEDAPRQPVADYRGTWTDGTNSGLCQVKMFTDGVLFVARWKPGDNWVGTRIDVAYGKFSESRTGFRYFTVQTEKHAYTGTAYRGVVRGSFRYFVSGRSGTVQCDPPDE